MFGFSRNVIILVIVVGLAWWYRAKIMSTVSSVTG